MLELKKLSTTNHIQINEMIEQFEAESLSSFRKIHRMIDLFETIIKTHTAVIIGTYFSLKDISDEIKSLLAFGLKTPSLGTWLLFSREIMSDLSIPKKLSEKQYRYSISKLSQCELRSIIEKCYVRNSEEYYLDINAMKSIKDGKKKLIKCFGRINQYDFSPNVIHNGFYSYYWKWIKYISDGNGLTKQDIISLRNNYAHGATPSEEECEADIKAYFPLLDKMLKESWLHNTEIIDCGYVKENKRIYLSTFNDKLIDLFPIIQEYNGKLYFLNDLKNFENSRSVINMLNYPFAEHIKLSDISEELLRTINIIEWKKNYSLNSEFINRINELSESFKGRNDEIKIINDFIDMKTKGILFITGNPGVGKSAIMARTINACKNSMGVENIEVIEYFIRRNTQQNQVKKLLKYLHDRLDNIYDTKIRYENNDDQDRENLRRKIQIIAAEINKKLVIVIDGLDEAIEKDEDNILNYIINECCENVILIYSGRWISEIKDFYLKLPVEDKSQLPIGGLKKEDIRAMLYEVCNKYDLEKNSEYVDKILEVSQGNPLFLKLLCLDIDNGYKKINNIETLPNNLDSFYEEILLRIEKKDSSSIILDSLYLITAAYDYVSPMLLELCLGLSSSEQQHVLRMLQEILHENQEGASQFQIYHESLREYIIKSRKEQVYKAHGRLIEFCKDWKENNEKVYLPEYIKSYAGKYFSRHISILEAVKEMEELILGEKSAEFMDYQYNISEQFDNSFETYRDAIKLFLKQDALGSVGRCSIKLLELHKRIDSSMDQIFSWVKSKDESLILKALKRVGAYNGLEKNNLYNLMLYYICKSTFEGSVKKELLEYAVNCSDSYLEIVDKKYDLPGFVFAWIIRECMRLNIDYSNLIKMQYRYYRVDCEDMRGFWGFIYGIFESFIENSEIESCIRIIECMEDYEVSVFLTSKLINVLYKKHNSINEIALDYMISNVERTELGIKKLEMCSYVLNIPRNKEINQFIDDYFNMLLNENYDFVKKQGTKSLLRYLENIIQLVDGDELSERYKEQIKVKFDSIEMDENIDILKYLNILFELNERDTAKGILKNWLNAYCDMHLQHAKEVNYGAEYKRELKSLEAVIYTCELYEEADEFKEKYLEAEQLDDHQVMMICHILSKTRNFNIIANIAERFEGNNKIQKEFLRNILYSEKTMDIDFIKESGLREQSSIYKLIMEKRTSESKTVKREGRRYWESRNEYLEEEKAFEEVLLMLENDNEEQAINSFKQLDESINKDYTMRFSIELYKKGYINSAEKLIDSFFTAKKEKLKTSFNVEEYIGGLNSIDFGSTVDEAYEDFTDEKVLSEGLIGHIPLRAKGESLERYILRGGRYMLLNGSMEQLMIFIAQVDKQIELENIVVGLEDYFIIAGYVKELLELDNRLQEDVYYKTQPILALVQYMLVKKNYEENREYIDTACRVIDSEIVKDAFLKELILSVDCYGFDIPRYAAVVMPHVIKNKQFVADLTVLYYFFQWIKNRENCSVEAIEQLSRLVSIENPSFQVSELKEAKVFTIDNGEVWVNKIEDEDDREEVQELLKKYKSGEIDRDKAVKKLNRITREYGLSID